MSNEIDIRQPIAGAADAVAGFERIKQTAKQAGKQLGPTFIAAWFYTTVGLVFGFGLLIIQKLLDQLSGYLGYSHKFWAEFVHFLAFMAEHLGIGFVVAAIAVFFYEWGAHIKKTMALAARLSRSIARIEETKTIIDRQDEVAGALDQTHKLMDSLHLTERLYQDIDKASRFNLKVCLTGMIGGPLKKRSEYSERAIESCERLILAIKKLREDATWGNDKYVEFIARHVAEVVGHNAEALSNLRRNGNKQDFTVPPTAAGMAAEILSRQMEAMEGGDGYDVISDLTSWEDSQLAELLNATKTAVESDKVQVRRIFNLLPYTIRGPFKKKLPAKHYEILEDHLRASETWKGRNGQGCYQIKILWREGYQSLREDPHWRNTEIERLHFGLFSHADESVKFSVTKTDLSDMEMRRQSRGNEDERLFTALWKAAKDFPVEGSATDRVRKVCEKLQREME